MYVQVGVYMGSKGNEEEQKYGGDNKKMNKNGIVQFGGYFGVLGN
jgi:hypothetical protein